MSGVYQLFIDFFFFFLIWSQEHATPDISLYFLIIFDRNLHIIKQ